MTKMRNEELGIRNSSHLPGKNGGGGVEIQNSKLIIHNSLWVAG
jgi:hypothetical protein